MKEQPSEKTFASDDELRLQVGSCRLQTNQEPQLETRAPVASLFWDAPPPPKRIEVVPLNLQAVARTTVLKREETVPCPEGEGNAKCLKSIVNSVPGP